MRCTENLVFSSVTSRYQYGYTPFKTGSNYINVYLHNIIIQVRRNIRLVRSHDMYAVDKNIMVLLLRCFFLFPRTTLLLLRKNSVDAI